MKTIVLLSLIVVSFATTSTDTSKTDNKKDDIVKATQGCDLYRCSTINMEQDTCIKYHQIGEGVLNKVWEINTSKCTDGKICNPADLSVPSDATCINKPPSNKGVDGDHCENNTQCYSNVCTDKICVGKADDTDCSDNEVCKIGSYCKSVDTEGTQKKLCKKLEKKDGDCKSDEDCISGYGCYNTKCTEYFSKDIGTNVGVKYGIYCKTYNVEVETGKCVDTTLTAKNDVCPDDNLNDYCKYEYVVDPQKPDDKKTITKDCACGPNDNTKYCPMASTNSKWNQYTNDLVEWTTKGAGSKTHTVNRMKIPMSLMNSQRATVYYPQYREMDSCFKGLISSGNFLKAGLIGVFTFITLFM